MERVNMLRTQAKILRDLASLAVNGDQIRDQLIDLAKQCDEIANKREQLLASGALKPSGGA